jgi:hypothetical protein
MAMSSMLHRTKNLLLALARADTAFFILPALMAILIVGTVAQRWMGLYDSQHLFFMSFIFWAGPVPLPGGALLIGTLTLGLSLKFIFKSRWSRLKAGINLTHLGVLILLAGGFLTALWAEESYMLIGEGQSSPYIYDYFRQEAIITQNDAPIGRVPFDKLKERGAWPPLPFHVETLQTCRNCEILKREEDTEDKEGNAYRGMAGFMALRAKRPDPVTENNLSGFTLKITGLDEEQNGIYIAFDPMPKPIVVTYGEDTYKLVFGKRQTRLPFSLELVDFKKETYPGMDMAKAYSSALIVHDGGISWPVTIEMNKPLRYKGYTFFQSSFEQTPETERTVLAVVKNRARLFPYIGTLIVALGLLLHIGLLFGRKVGT